MRWESWGNPRRPGASGRAQDLGPLSCNIGVAGSALDALMLFAQSRSTAQRWPPGNCYIAHRAVPERQGRAEEAAVARRAGPEPGARA